MPRRMVLTGVVLALAFAAGPTARAADFGYLSVLGCTDTPSSDPRTLNSADSVTVPASGSPVYVLASTPSGATTPDRVIAFDPGGRQLWSIDHTSNGVLGGSAIGNSSDGFYVGGNPDGFTVGRVTRFVAGAAGATEAASWEVTGEILSVVGGQTNTDSGPLEFVAVLTRTPPGGVYFFDPNGKSLGGLGFAPEDNFFPGVPKGLGVGGGRLLVADNASSDGFNITTGRIDSYGLAYDSANNQLRVSSVVHSDVPFHTAGIAGTSDSMWVLGGDDAGTFAHYSKYLQPVDTYTRSGATPGRTTQVPFDGIAADGLGNVYLADGDRVVKLGPGGSLPSPGTMVGQCGAAAGAGGGAVVVSSPAQNLLAKHGMVLDVACAMPCTSVARGTITIFGARKRTLRFKPDRELVPETRTRLHPRLTRAQLRTFRKALVAHVPARLKMTVHAVEPDGLVRVRVIQVDFA